MPQGNRYPSALPAASCGSAHRASASRALDNSQPICDETENNRDLITALRAACDFTPCAIACVPAGTNTRRRRRRCIVSDQRRGSALTKNSSAHAPEKPGKAAVYFAAAARKDASLKTRPIVRFLTVINRLEQH
ncbi:hypothetical protein [Rhizobium sp. N324]|uniref:hypothetical protein n=1 Tax=Rhizobium sp. N324 TaxID=1703969 RepID=UPI0011AB43A5|nr:hypothetical protein [Rhizobium sp. N324]